MSPVISVWFKPVAKGVAVRFCISQLELWQLVSVFDLSGDLACVHCWGPSFCCSLFTLLNSVDFLQMLSCSLCYPIEDDCWYHSSGKMVWQVWNILSPPSSLVLVSIHALAPLPSGVYNQVCRLPLIPSLWTK